jgi:hypothetical protein
MIKITSFTRGYLNPGDRARAVAMLRRRGFNHFVFYRDVASDFALAYGAADWVPAGHAYINR